MRILTENCVALVIDYQEKLIPAMSGIDSLLERSEILLKGLNALEVPMIVSQQYPRGLGQTLPQILENAQAFIRANWLGRHTADCVGLIKGYGWLSTDTMTIDYGTHGMPDIGANEMFYNATRRGGIETMPDTPGLAVWKAGHIGVYIGNGEVVEAMGTKYGVVKTQLEGRGWTHWLEIPYINYA